MPGRSGWRRMITTPDTRAKSGSRKVETNSVEALEGHIRSALGQREEWALYPGGWPDEIDVALIDAIFSARAKYGTKDSGVRAVIGRWREDAERKLDSLAALTERQTEELIEVLDNDQLVPGPAKDRPRKAEAVQMVARDLIEIGISNTAELRHAMEEDREAVRQAFTATYGVGKVTFSYFSMLLGFPDVKADRMIRGFVAEALGRGQVDPETARQLVIEIAGRMNVDPRDLDHAIWQWQRKRH